MGCIVGILTQHIGGFRNHRRGADQPVARPGLFRSASGLVAVLVGCSGAPSVTPEPSIEPAKPVSSTVEATVPVESPAETAFFTDIVFQSDPSGNDDGSGLTRLSDDPANDSNASLSPDGATIVFSSFRDGLRSEIYSMNADGTGQTNLTKNLGSHDYDPAWSPDGGKIVFKSARGLKEGAFQIYVMNADGCGPLGITDNDGYAWERYGLRMIPGSPSRCRGKGSRARSMSSTLKSRHRLD